MRDDRDAASGFTLGCLAGLLLWAGIFTAFRFLGG
jgi:hypothetical protein